MKNSRIFWHRLLEFFGVSSVDTIVTSFSHYAQKYNSENTVYCGITTISHYGIKERNFREVFSDVVYVSFEGKEYPAPIGYTFYLERLYGKNFMRLPPIEKRNTHHGYTAYWR